MEDYFASISISNRSALCVGTITSAETEAANAGGINIDGSGYYLFLADEAEAGRPIEVLAKFSTNGGAEKLSRLLRAASQRGA